MRLVECLSTSRPYAAVIIISHAWTLNKSLVQNFSVPSIDAFRFVLALYKSKKQMIRWTFSYKAWS